MHSFVHEQRSRYPSPAEISGAMLLLAPPVENLVERIGKKRARHEAMFGPLELIPRRYRTDRRAHELHVDLVHTARATNEIDQAIGRTLRRFRDAGGVTGMGYARLNDYARERLGQSLRWTQERLRLDRLFQASPRAAADHTRGELTTSHALAIASMITPDTESAWLTVAKKMTVRELDLAVREAKAAGRRMPPGYDEATPGSDPVTAPPESESPDPEPGVWISIPAPAAIADLFDHTIDVARRTAGSQLPVSTCMEHLLAEYGAAPASSNVEVDINLNADPSFVASATPRITDTPSLAASREKRLEVQHDRWRAIAIPPRPPSDDVAAASAIPEGERERERERERQKENENERKNDESAVTPRKPVPPKPRALDAELRRLILLGQHRHDRLAELLAEFRTIDGSRTLGFASLAHYAREMLGMSARFVQELERVANRLQLLPQLTAARARGEVSWTKLRLITSVARPDTEAAWLDHARRCTVRYLEREVQAAHHRRQTNPTAWSLNGNPTPLTSEPPYGAHSPLRPGANLWPEAHTSAPPDASDTSTAPAHTSAPHADAPNTAIPIDLPCRIRFWLPLSLHDWWHDTDDAIRETLEAGNDARPTAPWQRLFTLLRHYLQQWDTAAYENWSEGAEVHHRHGWMCACPGCTARRNLEQHHIVFRSQGGSDDASNLVTLCAKHHRRLIHQTSTVKITGRTDDALEWSMPAATYRGDVRIPK